MKMIVIYVLLLEDNKYYVGKTNNLDFRLEKHFNNSASAWTTKYKPIKIIETIKNCDDFDEDKYTLKYMSQYGIHNVRGGTYCTLVLDIYTINLLKKQIASATNKCYKCDSDEHFIKECNVETIPIEFKNNYTFKKNRYRK
jgi:hypothetical protein